VAAMPQAPVRTVQPRAGPVTLAPAPAGADAAVAVRAANSAGRR